MGGFFEKFIAANMDNIINVCVYIAIAALFLLSFS